MLTAQQLELVKDGPYRCLSVHPAQLYESASAAVIFLLLYLLWRRAQAADQKPKEKLFLTAPGTVFALMFIFYGFTRFFIEFLRDDNPFEGNGLTISQNISIGLVILGLGLFAVFAKINAVEKSRQKK